MRLLAHLVRKDVRAARGVWIVWLALVVADLWWQGAGPERLFLAASDSSVTWSFRAFLPFAELGTLLLLVAVVVQEDSIVDPAAFWHTRPIGPRRLLVAKLAASALLVLGPPLVVEAVRLSWLRVPLVDIARVDLELALGLAVPLVIAFAAAAVTTDLVRYLMLLVGGVASLLLGASVYRLAARPTQPLAIDPLANDPTKYLVMTLLLIAGVLWVMRDHFRRRDWRLALVGVALVLGTTQVLGRSWPDTPTGWPPASAFAPAVPEPPDAWASPSHTRVRLVRDRAGRDVPSMHIAGRNSVGRRSISAPLALDGLPEDYTAAPWTVAGRLEYADGTVLTSGPSAPKQQLVGPTFVPSATFGGGRFALSSGPSAFEAWPTLIEVLDPMIEAKSGVPGRYTGTFRYRVARHVAVATLPLVEGVSHADGPRRVRIDRVTDASGRCWIRLQATRPELRLASRDEPVLGYHFVDNLTGAKLPVIRGGWDARVGAAFRLDLSSGLGRPFATSYTQVAVGDLPGRLGSDTPETPRRCSLTSLVIVRTTDAGMLTRSLELDDFRLGGPWTDDLMPR